MKFVNRTADCDRLKQEIDQHRPLRGEALEPLHDYFRIGLTWTSNALEGNSLTETETKVVIEDGIAIGGKPLCDHYETIGHAEAFDHLWKLVKKPALAERDILALHRLLYHRIDTANAGRYRKQNITGTATVFPAPSELKGLMAAFVAEMPTLKVVKHPIEYAALLHNRLLTIHPFTDGNGRTARLLMNLALLQAGFPVAIIPPVLRADYLTAIRRGDTGDIQPFLALLSNMVWEAQRDYLRLLHTLERN